MKELTTRIYTYEDFEKRIVPFHIGDIFANIAEDPTIDQNTIKVVELNGIIDDVYCDDNPYRCRQEYIVHIMKDILDMMHKFEDYDNKIFTACIPLDNDIIGTTNRRYMVPIIQHFIHIFNFIGFESTQVDSNLEFRVPMVYSRNEVGRKYFDVAFKHLLDAYNITE